jgi:hypothetical protein
MSIPLNKPEVIATAKNIAIAQMIFGGLETVSGKAVSFILLLTNEDGSTVDTVNITLVGEDYNDFWNNSFNTNVEVLTFLKKKTGLDFPVNEEDADASFLNEIIPVEEIINEVIAE